MYCLFDDTSSYCNPLSSYFSRSIHTKCQLSDSELDVASEENDSIRDPQLPMKMNFSSDYIGVPSIAQKREYSIAYRGVHFNKSVSKYQTKLHHSNKQHSIGCYSLAADAALAFDKAATVLKGLGRRINFVFSARVRSCKAKGVYRNGNRR